MPKSMRKNFVISQFAFFLLRIELQVKFFPKTCGID